MGYQQAFTYSSSLKPHRLPNSCLATNHQTTHALVLFKKGNTLSYSFQSAKWAGQRSGPIAVWVQCPVPGGQRRSLGHDFVDCQTSIWQTGLRLQRQARAVSRCSRQLHAVLKLVLQAVWIQNCQPIQKTGQSKVWGSILWKKVKLLIVKRSF